MKHHNNVNIFKFLLKTNQPSNLLKAFDWAIFPTYIKLRALAKAIRQVCLPLSMRLATAC